MVCPRIRLSKSQYIKGLQCPLALWYFKNRKDLIPKIDAAKQALFDAGHEVGELAKQLYPPGVEIKGKFYEIAKFVNDTQKEIASGASILFEAAACTRDGLYGRIDILKKANNEDAWELIEVKSSTSVKPYHLEDMAVQLVIFEQAGFSVETCRLIYVNKGFVKNGPINPPDYFKIEDLTKPVRDRQAAVHTKINELLTIIAQNHEPSQPVGSHCNDPFECEFKHHCWKQIPDYSVYSLFKG
ncbi:Dna2/Cas4 domain-containing protein, partial [bacterium]|nr:Dna2/Cas4 domain-containing protein [bacterium]